MRSDARATTHRARAVTIGVAVALGLPCCTPEPPSSGARSATGPTSGAGPVVTGSPKPPTTSQVVEPTPAPTTKATTKATTAPTTQDDVLKALPGSADPEVCATAASRNMRSGGIGAGDFVEARRQYKATTKDGSAATVVVHVIPAHPGAMSGVKLSMTRLRKPVYTFNFSSTAHTTASGVRYYEMKFPVWYPGSWRLTFTSGSDQGCFDVAFNPPT